MKSKIDFTNLKVGDIIFWHGNERGDYYYKKWKITKINKCSLTLQKYKSTIDNSDDDRAFRNQTYGKIYYKWTDELTDEKKICYDEYFKKEGDKDYNDYLISTDKDVDYGR